MPTYQVRDKYYQMAKSQGYPSRAVFKLIEIQEKFKIIHPQSKIIDLGASPGGWFVYAASLISNTNPKKKPKNLLPQILGIDLLDLKIQNLPSCAQFIKADLYDQKTRDQIQELMKDGCDLVLSDMAPNTSGIAFKDAGDSAALCHLAFEVAQKLLKKNGHFVVKLFPGSEGQKFKKQLKENFQKLIQFTPKATRKTSREIYLIGMKFKKHPTNNKSLGEIKKES